MRSPEAAHDFATIHRRSEELRREKEITLFGERKPSLAVRYIEKRIETSRTKTSDQVASITLAGNPIEMIETFAWENAKDGFPTTTASYLHCDPRLPIVKKGEILAEAFANKAVNYKQLALEAPIYDPQRREMYEAKAKKFRKISQGLTRATKKV